MSESTESLISELEKCQDIKSLKVTYSKIIKTIDMETEVDKFQAIKKAFSDARLKLKKDKGGKKAGIFNMLNTISMEKEEKKESLLNSQLEDDEGDQRVSLGNQPTTTKETSDFEVQELELQIKGFVNQTRTSSTEEESLDQGEAEEIQEIISHHHLKQTIVEASKQEDLLRIENLEKAIDAHCLQRLLDKSEHKIEEVEPGYLKDIYDFLAEESHELRDDNARYKILTRYVVEQCLRIKLKILFNGSSEVFFNLLKSKLLKYVLASHFALPQAIREFLGVVDSYKDFEVSKFLRDHNQECFTLLEKSFSYFNKIWNKVQTEELRKYEILLKINYYNEVRKKKNAIFKSLVIKSTTHQKSGTELVDDGFEFLMFGSSNKEWGPTSFGEQSFLFDEVLVVTDSLINNFQTRYDLFAWEKLYEKIEKGRFSSPIRTLLKQTLQMIFSNDPYVSYHQLRKISDSLLDQEEDREAGFEEFTAGIRPPDKDKAEYIQRIASGKLSLPIDSEIFNIATMRQFNAQKIEEVPFINAYVKCVEYLGMHLTKKQALEFVKENHEVINGYPIIPHIFYILLTVEGQDVSFLADTSFAFCSDYLKLIKEKRFEEAFKSRAFRQQKNIHDSPFDIFENSIRIGLLNQNVQELYPRFSLTSIFKTVLEVYIRHMEPVLQNDEQ